MADSFRTDAPILRRRRLSAAEFHRMGEAAILKEDERVELIDGELVEMSPIGARHAGTLACLIRLVIASGSRVTLWPQNPVRLGRHSEPQPDLALLVPRADDYRHALPKPAEVLLLVEIADSSVEYDRTVKMPLYARSGIGEAWLVDLEEEIIEVHRDPSADGYRRVTQHKAGEVLSPEALPTLAVPLSGIFA